MGRGKQHGGRQVVPISLGHAQAQREDRTCPLCIELLDATEKQFFPCPCGYQVCLFCFERIKRDCSNLCPGCRTEYGSEKDPFQKGEVRQRVSSASSSAGVTPQKSRAPTSQRSSPMPSPSGRQTARSQDTAAVLHEGRQSTSPEPSKVPFPGTQNLHGQLSMDAEGQEAWEKTAQPDRSSAAEQEEGPYQEAQRRQPQDATMSTAIPGSTQQAILSNDDISRAGVDEDVAKARSRWLSASQALQNAAMRVGWGSWRFQKRRCDTPQTDPEGAALMSATRQAVREGHMNSGEAAAQLVSFLQHREHRSSTGQGSYQGNETEHIAEMGGSSTVQSWPHASQPGAAFGSGVQQPWTGSEQGHDGAGLDMQGANGWPLTGGAQHGQHADGVSRLSTLFAAPLQHTTGNGGATGHLLGASYQNGF